MLIKELESEHKRNILYKRGLENIENITFIFFFNFLQNFIGKD